MNTIITIGREYGSGGRDIARALSEKYNIPFYDKELLARAAKDSGICEDLFKSHDEKPTNSFLYSLVMDTYSMGYAGNTYAEMPINHKVFLAQFDTIKKIASEGPCVIVGRCADYALENIPNTVSVFIHADDELRTARIARRHNLSVGKAKDMMAKTDKRRSSYYNYYTNKKWGYSDSYDLCVDSGKLGIEKAAEVIENYVALREEALKTKIAL